MTYMLSITLDEAFEKRQKMLRGMKKKSLGMTRKKLNNRSIGSGLATESQLQLQLVLEISWVQHVQAASSFVSVFLGL